MYEYMKPVSRRCGPGETCMSMPLFHTPACRPPRPEPCGELWPRPGWSRPRPGPEPCPPREVVLSNPCNPCEQVTVALHVDECGNLVVCVRRGAY